MSSILIGGLEDPNIAVLKKYFDNFIDLNSNIIWDINKDYFIINNIKYKPKSIFIRYNVFNEDNKFLQLNNFSLIKNYYKSFNKIKVYNRYHYDRPIQKLTNLVLAKRIGLNIPSTEYSKNNEIISRVLKPIDGGQHAVEGKLANYSCIVQDKIIGINKRLYIIKDKYFCFNLISSKLDYRDDPNVKIKIDSLSKETINKSFKLAKKLNLNFCALDFMVNMKEYFLEINTNPMFSEFNKLTNDTMANTIKQELIK